MITFDKGRSAVFSAGLARAGVRSPIAQRKMTMPTRMSRILRRVKSDCENITPLSRLCAHLLRSHLATLFSTGVFSSAALASVLSVRSPMGTIMARTRKTERATVTRSTRTIKPAKRSRTVLISVFTPSAHIHRWAVPSCPSRTGTRVSYTVFPCKVTTRVPICFR